MNSLTLETKIIIGVIVTTALLLLGGIFFLSKNNPSSPISNQNEVVEIDYSKGEKIGSDSAKVKLVEFGDFACPACAVVEPVVSQIINAKYENFQFIFRNFPLTQHINSRSAANLAMFAASKQKYWQVHNKLYETQSQWDELADPSDFFAQIAKDEGLDPIEAKNAVKNQSFASQIQVDLDEATNIGVNSTPTFYLNGRKVIGKDYSDLKNQVEAELKK